MSLHATTFTHLVTSLLALDGNARETVRERSVLISNLSDCPLDGAYDFSRKYGALSTEQAEAFFDFAAARYKADPSAVAYRLLQVAMLAYQGENQRRADQRRESLRDY